MTAETPRPGPPKLSVVPDPVNVGLLDRVKSLIKPPSKPSTLTGNKRSEYILLLEQRQVERHAHVAQIMQIISRKQLEIDNLKRQEN